MKRRQQWSDASRSDYDLLDIVDQREFQNLADQINLTTNQRQRLIDSLYATNSWNIRQDKFTRKASKQPEYSVYEQAYQKWKDESSSECGFKQTYQSTLSLLDKQKRSTEITRLMKEYRAPEAVYSYNDKSKQISDIKDIYTKELHNLITKKNLDYEQARFTQEPVRLKSQSQKVKSQSQKVKEVQRRRQLGQIATKEKMVELAVQTQLLHRIRKINEEEREAEQRLKQEQELKKTCFIQMISNPPPQSWRNKQDKNISSYQALIKKHMQDSLHQDLIDRKVQATDAKSSLIGSGVGLKQVEPRYRLNIEGILKIPYKQFLIFYSDNYRQILGLASPEEMNKINEYRNQALRREEALGELQKKVASYGPEKIARLPAPARQKLFRILYQKQVDIQKSYGS